MMKIKNADRIVLPAAETDAHLRQREELRRMEDGEEIQPQAGEDHDAHIMECDAKIMELSPSLRSDATELGAQAAAEQGWVDVYLNQFVIPHRDAHKAMRDTAGQQLAVGAGGGTLPVERQAGTPGQESGYVMSGALGEGSA